jgi:hypothetical protein
MTYPEQESDIGRVRLFDANLVWPLQLEPLTAAGAAGRHWEVLEAGRETHAWRRVDDEFTSDPEEFRERHYREFVSFLPYVQRFLYGEGRSPARPIPTIRQATRRCTFSGGPTSTACA